MKNKPLVSIGIPAYKSRYLARAIDSILVQTYTNIEIIIVNDCSPQNIDEIIKQYDDKRIHYFINGKNVGANDPGENWNICLKYAKGDFFCLLCDDDTYEPTFIEEMLNLSEQYPDCNVFHSNVKVMNMQNKIIQEFPKFPSWESCSDYIINRSKGLRKQTISEWLYRRKPIVNLGGYENLPLAWGSDYLTIMKFAINGGIASTDKQLVAFRRSNENITMTFIGNCEKKIYALSLYKQKLLKLIIDSPSLSYPLLKPYVCQIKNMEDMPILNGATWAEYKNIVRKYKQYDVAKISIVKSLIKRIIKIF